ncbi:MAG: HEAT repeat domain-containing protein [Planctomycetes bacterium]|nr:HEAT repeat domain-containing protein [Planctomycetota bacterium]
MKIARLLLCSLSTALAAPAYAQWPPIAGSTSSYDHVAQGSGGGTVKPAGGSHTGPADTVPTGGRTGGGGSGGGAHGNGQTPPPPGGDSGTAHGTGPGATGGAGPRPVPTPSTLTMTSDDSWYLWWEYNKAEFLRPNQLDLLSAPASGDDSLAALQRFADSMRGAIGPALLEALSDGDPRLRSSAAIAYGRTFGPAAVGRLVALLDDANVEVRHGAILGLGATGASEAAGILLGIAKDGTRDGLGRERISPTAEAHAFVALALGRQRGFPAYVDVRLALRARERARSERETIGVAAMLYERLAPCPEFEALALQLSADESEAPIVRCRALEALAGADSEKAFERLVASLTGPRLDLRRSAALALGEASRAEALPALLAAYAGESESLTRGFLLTAIGRRGGPVAREFLLRVLCSNPKSMRAWSGLALGILGRKSADPLIAKALRDALEHESNPQNRSAYWLGLGLLHDEEALPLLVKAVAEASDPRNRMYAATALALLGGDEAHRVLRARLEEEGSALVRATLAQSLGCMGRGEDVDAIAATLANLNEPELQAMAATALGFHASYDALRRLCDTVTSKAGASLRRAAAIEGLGMVLGRCAPLALMDVARDSNYTVFNEWGNGLYHTTL